MGRWVYFSGTVAVKGVKQLPSSVLWRHRYKESLDSNPGYKDCIYHVYYRWDEMFTEGWEGDYKILRWDGIKGGKDGIVMMGMMNALLVFFSVPLIIITNGLWESTLRFQVKMLLWNLCGRDGYLLVVSWLVGLWNVLGRRREGGVRSSIFHPLDRLDFLEIESQLKSLNSSWKWIDVFVAGIGLQSNWPTCSQWK